MPLMTTLFALLVSAPAQAEPVSLCPLMEVEVAHEGGPIESLEVLSESGYATPLACLDEDCETHGMSAYLPGEYIIQAFRGDELVGETSLSVSGEPTIDEGDCPEAEAAFVTVEVTPDPDCEEPPGGEDPGEGGEDPDGDGLTTDLELEIGTDPFDADTDGDGLTDGNEVMGPTDPLSADSDRDGLDDGQEIVIGTDPQDPDTDYDGLEDGHEVELGTDPCEWDTDFDGYEDAFEVDMGTDPLDPNDYPLDHWYDYDDCGMPFGCSSTGAPVGFGGILLGLAALATRRRR